MRIGNRVEIHAGAVVGGGRPLAMRMAKAGSGSFRRAGIVEIGDDVEIGANTTIDRGSLNDTRIAEGVKIDKPCARRP